ncbi:MAG: ribonuclease HII, partial [Patescibacteria group bacterium]|nr:ribonuclease HII [Patescibacteria group bacterium]
MSQYVIGIDEAGRGALAGPVAVGAVLFPIDLDWKAIFRLVTRRGSPRLRDSKKLTSRQRSLLYEHIASHGRLRHACAFVAPEAVDSIGIVKAAHRAAAAALGELGIRPARAEVLLDAGLEAPPRWRQRSIVRGDESVPAIALASIVAKVSRDRLMEGLAPSYPRYGFEKHKGYGTLVHRRAIGQHGLSDVHRRTFCKTLLFG